MELDKELGKIDPDPVLVHRARWRFSAGVVSVTSHYHLPNILSDVFCSISFPHDFVLCFRVAIQSVGNYESGGAVSDQPQAV